MGRAPAAALLLLALAVVPLAPRIGSWALIEPDEPMAYGEQPERVVAVDTA